MADLAVRTLTTPKFKQYEFMAFSVLSFIGKSYLLVRLPYRDFQINAVYTGLLLTGFYCYFRFRLNLVPPLLVVIFLPAAVTVDVLGNYFHLYGAQFGPVQFDEFSHFVGSGLSLPPAFWLIGATTSRFGLKLPRGLLGFFSVTVTFSFCAYYEILELWDELFWGDFTRLHSPRDTPNDLQWDLAGIFTAVLITLLFFRVKDLLEKGKAPAEAQL